VNSRLRRAGSGLYWQAVGSFVERPVMGLPGNLVLTPRADWCPTAQARGATPLLGHLRYAVQALVDALRHLGVHHLHAGGDAVHRHVCHQRHGACAIAETFSVQDEFRAVRWGSTRSPALASSGHQNGPNLTSQTLGWIE